MPARAFAASIALSLLAPGCSLKQVALTAVADTLSSGTGGSFSQDEDLQFIGEALPFGLKLMESVGDAVPEHVAMKVTLASGFTQYGVVYVEWPAEQHKYDDFHAYRAGLVRARSFYKRANRYAMEGLDLELPGFSTAITADTAAALGKAKKEHVPLLFWGAASWLAAALTDLEDPENFGIFPVCAAMLQRAYTLDPDWDGGALHELFISLDPVLPGPGGVERAVQHYERALALQGGKKAGPHVSLATAVALPAQDKARFVALLEKALSVDPAGSKENRLANAYAQERARFLLDHVEDLFLD
jgi:predicted anti-sigma-YlaC factor YlaD